VSYNAGPSSIHVELAGWQIGGVSYSYTAGERYNAYYVLPNGNVERSKFDDEKSAIAWVIESHAKLFTEFTTYLPTNKK
jgi:hypothetical protein